jgi:hypothetical protein
LLPFYASDQFITLAIASIPLLWLATANPRLGAYMAIGAYVGGVVMIQRSTPSSLLLRTNDKPSVIELLDGSRFLRRTGNGDEWISTRGRLKRWETDTIRLKQTARGLLVTGGLRDLRIIAHRF